MARLNLVAANPQKEIKQRAPKAPRPIVVTPSNDDQKDHFITKNGLSYAGSHVIIDLWEAKGLDDRERIETALIDAVNEAGATLLHYSTDFVFDGELERPYDERDPPSPQGAYARSKVAGDAAVAAAAPRHFIVRVGCLYGRGGRWNDPALGIDWGMTEVIVSDRDRQNPPLAEIAADVLPA